MKVFMLSSKKEAFLYGISTVTEVLGVSQRPKISIVSRPYRMLHFNAWNTVGTMFSESMHDVKALKTSKVSQKRRKIGDKYYVLKSLSLKN